ncbi:MAG: SH3 domain-containing protein [Lachnospiraceae bacterium]|nr:SH3 domain-containing protein [Lachnospiraceae bacterium]
MKKKLITFLVVFVLILVVAAVGFGKPLYDKYSYGTEEADLDEYFHIPAGEEGSALAILLQDERLSDLALQQGGIIYFDMGTVRTYLTDIFYVDYKGGKVLATTAGDTYEVAIGGTAYSSLGGMTDLGYPLCFEEGDSLYLAADYVRMFASFSWKTYDRCVRLRTKWENYAAKKIIKDTQIRTLGGIKSPILRQMKTGETVKVLEEMETWSKVITEDGFIGYVENKRMASAGEITETPEDPPELPPYTSISLGEKVCLGFHAIGGPTGNDTLGSMLAEAKGINVIAPTWFSISGDDGSYRSFASADYVAKAHAAGVQVWGVLDDFNYAGETGTAVSMLNILSDTQVRKDLEQNLVRDALALGMDGINLDFEKLTAECETHYAQFLRELSVLCRKNGLIFSADNYVPFAFNNYQRLDVQGEVMDYVLIMGYDEHYHGSGDPGSVASISYITGGIERTAQMVPAEKILNALPFYTILWTTENGVTTDEYITLNNQAQFIANVGQTPIWDEETCQNYAEWTQGAKLYQIWLEDADSISVKLNVMNAHEIGGVGVWRIGYGTDEVWNLISLYAHS